MKVRNMAKVKLVKRRPENLMPGQSQGRKQPEGQEDEEEDFTFISLSSVRHDVLPGTQQQQDDAHGQGEQTAGGAAGQQAAAAVRQPAVNTPRTEKWVVRNGPWTMYLLRRKRRPMEDQGDELV